MEFNVCTGLLTSWNEWMELSGRKRKNLPKRLSVLSADVEKKKKKLQRYDAKCTHCHTMWYKLSWDHCAIVFFTFFWRSSSLSCICIKVISSCHEVWFRYLHYLFNEVWHSLVELFCWLPLLLLLLLNTPVTERRPHAMSRRQQQQPQ